MADAGHGEHEHDYLATDHLMAHVADAPYFEVPRFLSRALVGPQGENDGKIFLPQPLKDKIEPKVLISGLPIEVKPVTGTFTKFMALELVAVVLISVIFIGLGRKVASGARPKGKWWNFWESMLIFVRDDVARPAIGHHDGDKFLPYLWTMFFFVLINNLLGLVPWMGSATGGFGTTIALALMTFLTVVLAGMKKMGVAGFIIGLVPHMDLPFALKLFIWPMIFAIEILGLVIKHFILAVRLLANMMAGHLVLAVLIAFIGATAKSAAFYGVVPASILGSTALSLLELFVAFLQAYIFTFLSALFIGMAVHPH